MKLYICYSNHSDTTHTCVTQKEASDLVRRLTREDGKAWWWKQSTTPSY